MTYEHKRKSDEDEDEDRPKTSLPKAVRRSFISWVVPALCISIVMACFLVVQNWADGRYTTRKTMEDETSSLRKALYEEAQRRESESQKREILEKSVLTVDRKLDLIIYIMQRDGKIDPGVLKPTGP